VADIETVFSNYSLLHEKLLEKAEQMRALACADIM
jgi:hypothetical protein